MDSYGRLTQPLGLRMAEFPLSPMFAKMLLESGGCGCSKEISTIAAMMQIQNVMVLPANQKKAAVSQDCPPPRRLWCEGQKKIENNRIECWSLSVPHWGNVHH